MNASKPKPLAVTYREGGDWHPWALAAGGLLVHAIKFDDGSIFDTHNGWRKDLSEPSPAPIPPIDTRPLELIQLALCRTLARQALTTVDASIFIAELQRIISEHRT